jgi:hypothetical protein
MNYLNSKSDPAWAPALGINTPNSGRMPVLLSSVLTAYRGNRGIP